MIESTHVFAPATKASLDRTARIFDARTGEEIVILRHGDVVKSAEFSPDGSRIVTTSDDKTARLWDASTGREIAVLSGHQAFLLTAAFNRDGSRIVTAAADGTARLWEVATARETAVLGGHRHNIVQSAALAPPASGTLRS